VIALLAGRPAVRLAGAAGALLAVAAGPAAFAATSPAPTPSATTIALVQPGLTTSPAQRVAASERLTAHGAGRAGLVVWGESSVGYDLAADQPLLHRLEALSGRVGAQLLVNQDAVNQAGATSKQATLLGPGGVAGRYVKTRLVPFGEYIPFRRELGWLTAISRAAPSNIVTGTGAHVLHVTLRGGTPLTVGVLICFESAFPDMSRYDADHGARVIIYQTSDSTFQGSWAPAQHASLSALRAAETGRPVVQAALTGDSAAFDARGRRLAWAGSSARGVLLARLRLPAASARTPFDRLGDYVPLTALAVVALSILAALIRRGRARNQPKAPKGAEPQ
jgi:apolipoprotein N-acyltransferase